MGHSVLQVPIPVLDPFVRARTAHYDEAYLSADPAFVHAHITVLGPFLDEVDEASAAVVAAIAGRVDPFDVRLAQLATFADGVIHLRPEPAAPFQKLTEELWAAFPQCPPYGGEFLDTVPHLSLDLASDDVTEQSTRAALDLPADDRAERIDLAWYEPGNCRILRSFPLGESSGV